MAKKSIGIATGGTGGHVFPAVELAKQLEAEYEPVFFGVDLENNPFFPKNRFSYVSLDGANFRNGKLHGLKKILKGTASARREIKKHNISHMIGFGSFYSLPPLLASMYLRVPFSLYEPNIVPGKINRVLSRFAKHALVHFSRTASQMVCSSSLVDVHMRKKENPTQKEGREKFGLDEDVPTILVFGGSQGAVEINTLFLSALDALDDTFQIIHITGSGSKVSEYYKARGIKAYVTEFTYDITHAWAACDLAICRAGAGALLDQFKHGRPAILIPLRPSAGDHQRINAEFMANDVKGALLLQPEEALEVKIKQALDESHDLRESLVNYPHLGTGNPIYKAFTELVD